MTFKPMHCLQMHPIKRNGKIVSLVLMTLIRRTGWTLCAAAKPGADPRETIRYWVWLQDQKGFDFPFTL
jgi:hypothetical protein